MRVMAIQLVLEERAEPDLEVQQTPDPIRGVDGSGGMIVEQSCDGRGAKLVHQQRVVQLRASVAGERIYHTDLDGVLCAGGADAEPSSDARGAPA